MNHILDELCATCAKDENYRPCEPPCHLYQQIALLPQTLNSIEDSLAASQGAAQHYFNMAVDQRKAMVAAVNHLEAYDFDKARQVLISGLET